MWQLANWRPIVTTSAVLTAIYAGALWLARNWILGRLAHAFDVKLEGIRAQLRESEERFKADLRAKEAEIASLRDGALSTMVSRQVAVDQRRLTAVDQLWSAVTSLAPGKSLVMMMSIVKFETAAKEAERNPRFRQVFDALGGQFDVKSLRSDEAAKARPYVSPMAWATYSALVAVVLYAAMRWTVLKTGVGADLMKNDVSVGELLKIVLPHQAEYIDKTGAVGYYYLLEQVEAKLLQELQAMLSGVDTDKASVERAAEILRRSQEVQAATSGALAGKQLPGDRG